MRTVLARPVLKAVLPAVLLAGLAVPAAPTYAVADTCFGLAPTLVGTPGEDLTGTAGPDVVMTNGAGAVRTLAGDDTVCVTGQTYSVKTGADDDRVDWTVPRYGGSTDLGGGSDSYLGGNRGGLVDAGDTDDARAGVPLGVDTIQTGSGTDSVITGHLSSGALPNGDSVRLGGGRDDVVVRGAVPQVLDGGSGMDEVALKSTVRGDWVVDGRTGVASVDGVAMPPALSFSTYVLNGLRWDSLAFLGGPGNDTVDVSNNSGLVKNDGPFTARMGGGKDWIYARSQDSGPFNGGPGNDSIRVEAKGTAAGPSRFTADLAQDSYRLTGSAPVRAASLENLTVSDADGATVRGDGKANRLGAYGCGNLVHGGNGDDRILGGAIKGCYDDEATPGLLAYGDAGNDVLVGGPSRDRLFGGPGVDKADGWYGRDQCVAEIRTRCER